MKKFALFVLIIITIAGCLVIKTDGQEYFIGNFPEHRFEFFESFRHESDSNFYTDLPYDLKFGGIRPYPYNFEVKQEFKWLRNPENLRKAFNAFYLAGLDNFVSRNSYFSTNNKWGSTEWKDKSLDQVVKGFLDSDTTATGDDYYSKFWLRRRNENTLSETYKIFMQIDGYYSENKMDIMVTKKDTILNGLIAFEAQLRQTDTVSYQKRVVDYFGYLKTVGLQYSAYKLIAHNSKLDIDYDTRDSLIGTLSYDSITRVEWEELDDNQNGWITWWRYRDPRRYYGP
ncbi:MAG: hypothetical protein OEY34_04215 [Cyclobacteriaceae bacterium]|nr:hypothetical protein [Cyclobacteriaceae bacterium]